MAEVGEELLFAGLKVLDVATWIAGPVAGTILADFGAEVIKIEQPGVGDPYRNLWKLPSAPQASANYGWLTDARNKRSLSLNLKDPEARDVLIELVRECDVYITNQPLPMRRQFGLTYEDLAPMNERMIYASLTAYGEEGPDAEREGFDGVAWWARSGLADLVRAPGASPGGSVPGMGDHPTAVALYAAIVTALLRRERTGKGSHVRTNLLHNGVWANACFASAAFIEGVDFAAMKADRPPIVGRQLYATADGRLLQLYMVRTQAELDALLIAAGAFEILNDERFESFEARTEHVIEFIEAIRAILVRRTADAWMEVFRAANVPVSLIAELADLTDDIQLQAVGVVSPPTDPSIGARFVINPPISVNGMPQVGALPAPDCGEHTGEILRELGRSEEAIRAMRARGAV